MRWLKRERWKAGIALAGMLLLLVLMIWVPVSAADTYEGASGLATSVMGTVQATPIEDATVTALNKEKLAREVEQLKEQNAPDLLVWLRTNASTLLSTLVVVIGGLIAFWRWLRNRRDEQAKRREDQHREQEKRAEEQQRWLADRQAEREKRAEERFQAVVEGLGSERNEAKIGAAITLRTFLRPGYEQFYIQTFDLAVAHLRFWRTSSLSEDPGRIPHSLEDPNTPLPLTTLRRALVVVFREAFPLARERLKEKESNTQFYHEFLNATDIQLDNAYLSGADLKQLWMKDAFLREASLFGTDLSEAHLTRVNCSEADLHRANFRKAYLRGANFSKADFIDADLSEAKLWYVNLTETNIEDARSLKDTDLRGATGLTKEQLEACKAKGAITDEAPSTNQPPSRFHPQFFQSNDAQVPSVPPAQVNTPAPDTDGSNAASSQPNSGA
jgi:uncharacterized protein YjbI with pentapeptide repeats